MNTQNMRVSDAERAEVADRLATNFADGRLDQAEYDERVSRAMNAKTHADFEGLFDDLPGTGAPTGDEGYGKPGIDAPYQGRRRGPLHVVLTVALILIGLSIANHVFWGFFSPGWFFGPWWILAVVVLIIMAARRRR
jgi:hypothetical protein